jgi:hypothetical protein
VKVNQIKKKTSVFQRLNLSQWSEAYSIPVKFRIRFRWAAAKNKKDREIKEHLPKFFLQNEKNALNHAVWFYAEPCMAERHVQEDKKNKGRTELVRPHHSCQFEIMRPDLLCPWTMALDPTFGSFTLLEPVSH